MARESDSCVLRLVAIYWEHWGWALLRVRQRRKQECKPTMRERHNGAREEQSICGSVAEESPIQQTQW